MNGTPIALALLMGLTGCGLTSTQAVYEEIRAQEKAKAAGTGAATRTGLPSYDAYRKEREQISRPAP